MKNLGNQTEVTLRIGPATLEHLSAITEIYNEAILGTVATFDTTPKTLEEQKIWFDDHGLKYPVLVAEQDGLVAGWASLSKWSDRCAYSDTAEVSLYVKEEHQGKGIGRKLLRAIMIEGKKAGLHTVIARIAEGGEATIHLHTSEGFEHIGTLREVGRKFGKLLDVYLMQKIYDTAGSENDATQAEKRT
jgi:L-amino acid N-acyltransferase YncA